MAKSKPTTEERFWSKLAPPNELGCRLYTGCKNHKGYGLFGFNGVLRSAHRVAYELTYGPIPPGLLVCHTCDNPPCCTPEHLWTGTQAENLADMSRKGRSLTGDKNGARRHPETRPRGILNNKAKTNEAGVIEIRARYKAGEKQRDIAASFGLRQATVWAIIHHRTWAHVKTPLE